MKVGALIKVWPIAAAAAATLAVFAVVQILVVSVDRAALAGHPLGLHPHLPTVSWPAMKKAQPASRPAAPAATGDRQAAEAEHLVVRRTVANTAPVTIAEPMASARRAPNRTPAAPHPRRKSSSPKLAPSPKGTLAETATGQTTVVAAYASTSSSKPAKLAPTAVKTEKPEPTRVKPVRKPATAQTRVAKPTAGPTKAKPTVEATTSKPAPERTTVKTKPEPGAHAEPARPTKDRN